MQVFTNKETMDLMLTIPPFMEDWKKKWLND
jgi:type I restriction-modification system DNA methylase subunit